MLDPRQLRREEGEGRVDRRHGHRLSLRPHKAGEIPVADAGAAVEEALQGLGQLLAVKGVGDEVAPGLGHALGPADVLDGHAREDLHQEVVVEAGHRTPLGAIHGAGPGGKGRAASCESGRDEMDAGES